MSVFDGLETTRPEPGFMSAKKPFFWTTIEDGVEVRWENVRVLKTTGRSQMYWRKREKQ